MFRELQRSDLAQGQRGTTKELLETNVDAESLSETLMELCPFPLRMKIRGRQILPKKEMEQANCRQTLKKKTEDRAMEHGVSQFGDTCLYMGQSCQKLA